MLGLNEHINVFGGEIVQAEYRDLNGDENRGNPLLAALPNCTICQGDESRLWRRPSFTPEDRQKEGHLRSALAWSLTDLFVPLPHVLALEKEIYSTLRMGYQNRNPARPKHWPEAFRRAGLSENEASVELSATLRSLQGVSGTGKTTAVRQILSQYPQVINHTGQGLLTSPHIQIVWLSLDCPDSGSPKDLCISFFQSVDDIIGTNYLELYNRNERTPARELLSQAARVAIVHSLGLLIIDEIEFFGLSQDSESVRSAIHWLSTVTGIPILLVGTGDADRVVNPFMGESSNNSSTNLVWRSLENDGIWKHFVTTLWEYQYLNRPAPLTPELSDALFNESHGILDLAIKVYLLAQMRAISTKSETLTPELIQTVSVSALKLVRQCLE